MKEKSLTWQEFLIIENNIAEQIHEQHENVKKLQN